MKKKKKESQALFDFYSPRIFSARPLLLSLSSLPPLFGSLSLRSSSPYPPPRSPQNPHRQHGHHHHHHHLFFFFSVPLSVLLKLSLSLILYHLPSPPSLPPSPPSLPVKKRGAWERHCVRIAGSRWRLSAPADSLCRSDLSPLH